MSKPRITAKHHPKHFLKDNKLEIFASHSAGKITGFKVKKDGKEKEFPVVKHNILKAWEELEKWIGTVKKD